MLSELGMPPADLRTRERTLNKLNESLAQGTVEKQRKTLRSPEPLSLRTGDVYAYPVDSQGNCVNPYMTAKDLERHPFVASHGAHSSVAGATRWATSPGTNSPGPAARG
jgi:hypothetical protein